LIFLRIYGDSWFVASGPWKHYLLLPWGPLSRRNKKFVIRLFIKTIDISYTYIIKKRLDRGIPSLVFKTDIPGEPIQPASQ
jgi:hypothetical protein